MARPERNGDCAICDGKIRYYPPPENACQVRGTWSHLNREDWIDSTHDAEPTEESLRKAGIAS